MDNDEFMGYIARIIIPLEFRNYFLGDLREKTIPNKDTQKFIK